MGEGEGRGCDGRGSAKAMENRDREGGIRVCNGPTQQFYTTPMLDT